MGRKNPNYGPAIKAQEQATNQALAELERSRQRLPNDYNFSTPFANASSSYDPVAKTVRGDLNLDPRLKKIFSDNLDLGSDFEEKAKARENQYQENYLASARRDTQNQLGDAFGLLGRSGRNNSAGQASLARLGEEISFQDAQRRQQLGEKARTDLLKERQALNTLGNASTLGLNEVTSSAFGGIGQSIDADQQSSKNSASTAFSGGQNVSQLLADQEKLKAQQRQAKSQQAFGLIPKPSFDDGTFRIG